MDNLLFQMKGQFKYIPRAILMTILFIFVYLYIKENGKKTLGKVFGVFKEGWVLAFLFYCAYMVTGTVYVRYSKRPTNSILSNLWFRAGDIGWNNEIIKNILFFIPLTFLFLQAFKPKRPVIRCIILSACATAFIEFSQLLFWIGEFQIADLIYNFTGGMIGCGIWLLMKKP